jgi:hypothetical protein
MIYRTSDVFVPGGMPKHTYIPRSEKHLEQQLKTARENLCKLVTLTGMTKSGKTVLANSVFPREKNIWVDGGAVRDEDDFWLNILDSIDGYTELSQEKTEGFAYGTEGNIELEGKVPFAVSGKGHLGGSVDKTRGRQEGKSLGLSPRSAAISQLRKSKAALIIDDFHYLKRDFQGSIVRALKPLIFEGLPVVLIAIPHRRFDSVKVEREITGRIQNIAVPMWDLEELIMIPEHGFPLLNMHTDQDVCAFLAKEAYGSPHLMQEFCKKVAQYKDIQQTSSEKVIVEGVSENIFYDTAEGTGKVIFDKLAKGPRQRTDRIPRKLKDGGTADIYQAILLALVHLKPGLTTVDYESMRTSLRDVLAEGIPQAHEVTRVLEKMSKIAASDEASTPVIDWEKDEQKLHITDPFFAFYLKWSRKDS